MAPQKISRTVGPDWTAIPGLSVPSHSLQSTVTQTAPHSFQIDIQTGPQTTIKAYVLDTVPYTLSGVSSRQTDPPVRLSVSFISSRPNLLD